MLGHPVYYYTLQGDQAYFTVAKTNFTLAKTDFTAAKKKFSSCSDNVGSNPSEAEAPIIFIPNMLEHPVL